MDVPLREYTDRAIADLKGYVEARLAAVEEKARGANEWRGAMDDRERNFARSDEARRQFEKIDERLKHMENARANLDGRMAMFAALPLMVSIAGLIVALTR